MIEIKTIEDRALWDDFIEGSKPHTFLHTWEWGEHQKKLDHEIFRFGVFKKSALEGVAFLYVIRAKRGSFLFCPNGPLIDWSNAQNVDALFARLKTLAHAKKVDALRVSPIALRSEKMMSLFKKHGFKTAPMHVHQEISWILDITPGEEELLSNMKKSTRYAIRKAQKDGVKVTASATNEDFDIFYDMSIETVRREKFVPFTKEYMHNEFKLFAKGDKVLLYIARYRGTAVASAIIIFSNGSAYYHYGASVRTHQSISASELLQWEAIREAKRRGMKLYNFWGIAPDDKPNHPWRGLTKFKQGFGGYNEVYVPTQDFPLTKWYFVVNLFEHIRKLKRGY